VAAPGEERGRSRITMAHLNIRPQEALGKSGKLLHGIEKP